MKFLWVFLLITFFFGAFSYCHVLIHNFLSVPLVLGLGFLCLVLSFVIAKAFFLNLLLRKFGFTQLRSTTIAQFFLRCQCNFLIAFTFFFYQGLTTMNHMVYMFFTLFFFLFLELNP